MQIPIDYRHVRAHHDDMLQEVMEKIWAEGIMDPNSRTIDPKNIRWFYEYSIDTSKLNGSDPVSSKSKSIHISFDNIGMRLMAVIGSDDVNGMKYYSDSRLTHTVAVKKDRAAHFKVDDKPKLTIVEDYY